MIVKNNYKGQRVVSMHDVIYIQQIIITMLHMDNILFNLYCIRLIILIDNCDFFITTCYCY